MKYIHGTIYGIIPIPVFYVDDLDWAAGRSYGFFIRIKKDYKDDRGLLEHELQHCRQFYRTLMLHPLLYKFSKTYRYNSELECYRVQLSFSQNKNRSAKHFVKYITTWYKLDVLPGKALSDLLD